MQTTQVKHYDIYGVVFNAACRMPAEQRNDPWLVCSVIVSALDEYYNKLNDAALAKYCDPDPAPTPPRDVFDTEHTDDIPAEIKPKKSRIITHKPIHDPTLPDGVVLTPLSKMAKVQKTATKSKTESVVMPAAPTEPSDNSEKPNDPEPIDPESELPPFNPAWCERFVDFNKYYLGKYSNPCSTQHGQCGGPCYQTELWLYNKTTDYLSVRDAEFYSLDELRATLDPYVKYAHEHRVVPEHIDTDIAEKQEQMVAECREHRKNRAKTLAQLENYRNDNRTQMERFVDLYNQGLSNVAIASQMGLVLGSVYAYKNKAKAKGLIK